MKRTIIQCEQRSEEWYLAHLGLVTSSNFDTVLSSKSSSGRKTYMMKLLAERMTGIPQTSYSNLAMENGIETEPFAREYYEAIKNIHVEQLGFIRMGEVGSSPDGLVGDDGMIEIKCPYSSTHLGYILANKMPSSYVPQVQGQLWICERQWCDFISYDPKVKSRPFWSIRVERDEDYIKNLSNNVDDFVQELLALENRLRVPF
jgi:putative phage-type endonuclease